MFEAMQLYCPADSRRTPCHGNHHHDDDDNEDNDDDEDDDDDDLKNKIPV